MEKGLRILRMKQVEDITSLSKSTIYRYIRDQNFPKPINLTDRLVGWIESEVLEWLQIQIDNTRGTK